MLGVSGLIGSASADGAAAAQAQESGGTSGGSGGTVGTIPGVGGGFSEEDKARIEEEGGGGGGGGGNRWPRPETLALLKIRSDMDVTFRDSSLKGPLWEQVSRKMADLGFHRSAKKCKEKFENVYKYHKRTKDGRSSKSEGKTYRFFDQLEALENTSSSSPQAPMPTAAMAMPMQAINVADAARIDPNNPPITSHIFVSSTPLAAQNTAANTAAPQSFNNFINSSFPPSQPPVLQPPTTANVTNPASHLIESTSFMSNSMSSSSSTSSDEDIERRHKRKRKWKDFFERLMKDVIDKQEELQKRFLETLEKRERDRMIREEAWRVQEMARINREHDLLVQERSMAATRESALVTFLQKFTQQQNPQNPNSTTNASQVQTPVKLPENSLPQQAAARVSEGSNNFFVESSLAQAQATTPAPVPIITPISTPAAVAAPPPPIRTVDNTPKSDNGGENFTGTTSSRWPKAEVEALIHLRTSMDNKYQENGPKGPLWEDISAGMRKLGYNRNAKRCKEKWENINKYFKKVKESNKKRTEDSKTCPYFHQLEALYKKKTKTDASSYAGKHENAMIPIMARPEQQWPLPQDPQHQHRQLESGMEEHEGDNIDQNDHDDTVTPRARNPSTEDDDYSDDGDDDEEDEGSGYEIVTNKPPSSIATTTVG